MLTIFCYRLSCQLIALCKRLSPSLIEIIDFKTTLVPPAVICFKDKVYCSNYGVETYLDLCYSLADCLHRLVRGG